jgi:hypothetical protein
LSDNPFAGHIEELRQIGGEEAPSPKPKKRPRRPRQDRFVMMTEKIAVLGFQAVKCPAALVWFEILFRAWSEHQTTVELPNKRLAELGVSRWVKHRALARLETHGVIRVTRRNRRSPLVTLLIET